MDRKITDTLEYNKILQKLREKCQTTQGRELAENLEASSSFDQVQEMLNETTEAVKIYAVTAPSMSGAKDIRESMQKTKIGSVLEALEILDIRSTMATMREVKRFFKELEIEAPILKSRASQLEILGNLESRIDRTLDDHGAVKDNASVELQRIRQELRNAQVRIKERITSILQSQTNQKYFQEAIVTMRGDRYVIPIKQEYRREFPGLVHDQSATAATLFIEPMAVVELGNTVRQMSAAEKNEVQRILRVLSVEINNQRDILLSNASILSAIDFSFAKAALAREMRATEPVLNNEGRTNLHKARHPLIADELVVPIDIEIGDRYKMLLITGPNTGGKTVSLKTLGLMALMTQSGLYIPAEYGSEMAIYNNVYAVIGDEQSIEQSLSTFSAHMRQLVDILNKVETSDLVLLDEVGAGTDPEEGSALAQSILERLIEVKATTLATTHYSQLKTFAYSNEGIENACVEFNVETLKPTYRLMIGMPGASNAFAISQRLGLSETMIKRAKQLMAADHANFEKIISALENERIVYEQRNEEILQKQQQIEKTERQVNAIRDELNKNKAEIMRKAREKSATMIRKTKREAEEIIESLKEQFDDLGVKRRQQAIQEAREKLNEAASEMVPGITNQRIGKRLDREKLSVGDTVYITKLDQKGVVTAISKEGNELTVQVGALTANVKSSICRFVSHGNTTEEIKPTVAVTSTEKTSGAFLQVAANIQREIDVRGLMVNEAESIVGKFIDDAALSGLKTVLIIHGKGTGALRKGIHEFLKHNKSVANYQFADIDEGGTGATIVTIK